MRKTKTLKAGKTRPRGIMFNIRLTPEEYLSLTKIADDLAGGNMSAWVRQRILQEDPELSQDMLTYLKQQKDHPLT